MRCRSDIRDIHDIHDIHGIAAILSKFDSPHCSRMIARRQMTGRKIGDEIVQEYRTEEGKSCQWLFTEITPASFHWINRQSADNGESWTVRGEFFLQRRAD
jgi:hypothetical protein